MVMLMSFVEVGPPCLENSNTWFVSFASQAHRIKPVRGGWSAVLRRVLHRLLIGPCSLSHGGVLANYVDGAGRQRRARILASLHTCLTDGEGHQVTLQWNGPSSMKPSFDFANVFKLGSGMVGDGHVDISCSDLIAMRRWSLEHWLSNIDSVLEARERLERGELSVAQLKENHQELWLLRHEGRALSGPRAPSRCLVHRRVQVRPHAHNVPGRAHVECYVSYRGSHVARRARESHRWSTVGVFSGHMAIQSATL